MSNPSFPNLPKKAKIIGQNFYSFKLGFQLLSPQCILYTTLNPLKSQENAPLSTQIVRGLMSNNTRAYRSQRSVCNDLGKIELEYSKLDSSFQEYELYAVLAMRTEYEIEVYDKEDNVKKYDIKLPQNINLLANKEEKKSILQSKNPELAAAIEEAEKEIT